MDTAAQTNTETLQANESYDLQNWSERLNITANQLEEAIQAVGPDRAEDYLDKVYF